MRVHDASTCERTPISMLPFFSGKGLGGCQKKPRADFLSELRTKVARACFAHRARGYVTAVPASPSIPGADLMTMGRVIGFGNEAELARLLDVNGLIGVVSTSIMSIMIRARLVSPIITASPGRRVH